MKKLLVTIVACLICLYCPGQDCMSFKGIPFNTSLSEFTKQMTSKGMVLLHTQTEPTLIATAFKGDFAGQSDCEVYAFSTLDKSCIFKVVVYLPAKTTWYDLKNCYNGMLDSYTDKYGEPKDDYKVFSSPYYDGDGYEMSAVANEKCIYAAFWEFSYGTILMEISKFKQVRIAYEDANNIKKVIEKKRQAINDDI